MEHTNDGESSKPTIRHFTFLKYSQVLKVRDVCPSQANMRAHRLFSGTSLLGVVVLNLLCVQPLSAGMCVCVCVSVCLCVCERVCIL